MISFSGKWKNVETMKKKTKLDSEEQIQHIFSQILKFGEIMQGQ